MACDLRFGLVRQIAQFYETTFFPGVHFDRPEELDPELDLLDARTRALDVLRGHAREAAPFLALCLRSIPLRAGIGLIELLQPGSPAVSDLLVSLLEEPHGQAAVDHRYPLFFDELGTELLRLSSVTDDVVSRLAKALRRMFPAVSVWNSLQAELTSIARVLAMRVQDSDEA